MTAGLVCGYLFKPGGVVTPLTELPDPGASLPDGGFIWVHLDALSEETAKWLMINPSIHREIAAALLAEETRPRCEEFDDGLLINLRGVNTNPGSDAEDMVSLRSWLSQNLLVTTRRRKLMAIKDVQSMLEKDWRPECTGAIMVELATCLTSRMDNVVQALEDEIDEIEEVSVEGHTEGQRSRIQELRRVTIILRRFMSPQKDALDRLYTSQMDLIHKSDKPHLRELIDRLTRIVEQLEGVRDRGGILNDQIADQRAEEMNRNMLVLSVVAAMFLPLGFLTGLLGINVGGIPGASDPWAFWIVVGGLTALSVGLLFFFRKIRWL